MDFKMPKTDYRRMSNDELVDLLLSAEDQLPKPAADEIVRRGAEIVPELSDIVMDRTSWIADIPEWWAPVHATYLLGAIGGDEVVAVLLASLRWSDAYDNEWVTEDLPSILGSLGEASFDELVNITGDRSAGWSARSIAMDALGSQALKNPSLEEQVIAIIGSILNDTNEERGARRSAAYVLIDFRRMDYKDVLMKFAQKEEGRNRRGDYRPSFTEKDIERDLTSPRCGLDMYTRDWLEFYEPEEILRRSERFTDVDERSKELH